MAKLPWYFRKTKLEVKNRTLFLKFDLSRLFLAYYAFIVAFKILFLYGRDKIDKGNYEEVGVTPNWRYVLCVLDLDTYDKIPHVTKADDGLGMYECYAADSKGIMGLARDDQGRLVQPPVLLKEHHTGKRIRIIYKGE